MPPFRLIATATFGLESVVARELAGLGYESATVRPGWLAFDGDAEAVARTNLWLRASDRVLLRMGEFEATDFGELYDRTRAVAWESLLPRDASFPVRGRSVRSQLSSVPACQRIVKKAIVDRLMEAHGVSSLLEDGPSFPVEVALLKDEVTLAVDTSGQGLHKRGYRPVTGEAPLKETLAAGLILLSFWEPGRPFLDPFCGTGTLPIEAALIAGRRAPGLGRTFAAETWPTLPRQAWTLAREQAKAEGVEATTAAIVGSDQSSGAVSQARANAARAGVEALTRFEQRAFEDLEPEADHGCLVTNPPYGERLEDHERVRELYRGMPEVLRRFPSWSHYVLTSVPGFEALIGQSAGRRRKLYNGRIECTYYQFAGPRPGGAEQPPSFGGIDERGERQLETFASRLAKRARHLRKWPTKRGIDAFRIYDFDIKEVPVAVDRFGDHLWVTPAARPVTSRTRAQQRDWLDAVVATAARVLGVEPEHARLHGGAGATAKVVVSEQGLRFEVRLGGTGPTGLALEGRRLRQNLKAEASGMRMLSFGEAGGAFAVAAMAGGAAKVVSVEPTSDRVAWLRSNVALNELDPACLRMVAELPQASDLRYDRVVVEDPPSEAVLEACRALLAEDGVLFVLRHTREKVPDADELTERLLPEDFRSRRRVRVWRYPKAAAGA